MCGRVDAYSGGPIYDDTGGRVVKWECERVDAWSSGPVYDGTGVRVDKWARERVEWWTCLRWHVWACGHVGVWQVYGNREQFMSGEPRRRERPINDHGFQP
jgi:hypothetical protein